jgi:hypothetical protein
MSDKSKAIGKLDHKPEQFHPERAIRAIDAWQYGQKYCSTNTVRMSSKLKRKRKSFCYQLVTYAKYLECRCKYTKTKRRAWNGLFYCVGNVGWATQAWLSFMIRMASEEGTAVDPESSEFGILGLPELTVGKVTKLLSAYTLILIQSRAGLTNASRIFSASSVYKKGRGI